MNTQKKTMVVAIEAADEMATLDAKLKIPAEILAKGGRLNVQEKLNFNNNGFGHYQYRYVCKPQYGRHTR